MLIALIALTSRRWLSVDSFDCDKLVLIAFSSTRWLSVDSFEFDEVAQCVSLFNFGICSAISSGWPCATGFVDLILFKPCRSVVAAYAALTQAVVRFVHRSRMKGLLRIGLYGILGYESDG